MKRYRNKVNFYTEKSKSSILIIISLIILFFVSSCEETIKPPDIEDPPLEYTWTIDTLKNPNGYGVVPWSIWGNSDSSVWIAGFNLAGQGELFHWDGIEWKRVTPDLGFNYEVLSIFGFAENDVYVVGSKLIIDSVLHTESLILHYDGVNWQRENVPIGSGLLNIHGRNPNDIWACGYYGSLYHKTGSQWVKVSFDERKYLGLLSEPPDLGPIYVAPNGEVFLMNKYYNYKEYGDTAMLYFSKHSNNTWEDLDSCRLVNINSIPTGYKFGDRAMWGVSGNEIYSVSNWGGLFKFDGISWLLTTWEGKYNYKDVEGISWNKIFTVGEHGTIRYFDGGSWKRIGDFSQFIVDFYSVMPFENEIFIGAYQLGIGYVVHGKVKK